MGKNNEKDNGYVVQLDNTRVKQPLVQKKFRKATPTEQITSYILVFGFPKLPQLSLAPSRTKEEREMIREIQEALLALKRLKEKGLIIRENIGFVPLVGDALDLGITGYEVATGLTHPAMLGLSAIGFLPFGDLFKKGKNWTRAKLISREMKDVVDGGLQYFGKVKYYGPTMGKTTASKTNPDLVDFDDFTREAKETLAKKLNISTRVLQSSPKYALAYLEMLEKLLDSWRRNPLNANKTLVISKKGLADKNIYNNEPSIPDRQTFIQRLRNRGETDDANSNDWYNMLLKQNPNLRIDNRFVSEIEYNPHYAQSAKNAGEPGYTNINGEYKIFPITGVAPQVGIKLSLKDIKSGWNNFKLWSNKANRDSFDRFFQQLSNLQWDDIYNEAIKENNLELLLKIRDSHFRIKAPKSETYDYWYHSTNKNFNKFNMDAKGEYTTEPLKHVGTKKAAEDIGGRNIHKLFINLKNSIETPDGVHEGYTSLANELYKQGKISLEELNKFRDRISNGNEEIRKLMLSKNIDGTRYVNLGEDIGSVSRSFVKPSLVKKVDAITRDDLGNIIPISKRDDFNNEDFRYSWIIPLIGISTISGLTHE